MSDTIKPATSDDAGDAGSLAVELARAYRQMAAFYRDQLQLDGPDADRRVRGRDATPDEAAADLARIRERPPDQVSWFDLNHLADRDPDAVAVEWRRIRDAARDELVRGHRTAQALEWQGRPWSRARFLAIRDSFRASTPAQGGIDAALIDMAAEAFSDYLEWSEHLHMQASTEAETERHRLEKDGYWPPPRLGMAEAIEQSSRMAERAHQRFLRTVKTLHEVRRLAGPIYVSRAGQVNVGSQQVNFVPTPDDPRSE
jgi:hypothetical protein